MMRSLTMSVLLGCLLSSIALAGPPRPDDFAVGFPIETQGDAALWRLSLPAAVYRTVTRADLGDLRVFDQGGNPVPHALRRPRVLDMEAPAAVELPFFPLFGSGDSSVAGHSMRIVTNDQGAIINVEGGSASARKSAHIDAYLIDTSALERPPNALSLTWEGGVERGFAANPGVDSSDDLSHWRPLVSKASLADLRFGDARLTHREIALPPRKARYLRLRWPAELREVRITSIRAGFPGERRPPPRQWLKLSHAKITEEPPALEFRSGGHWPVDRVRLAFPGRNGLLRGGVESRSGPDAPWQSRHQGLFYRLQHDGTELASEPAEIGPTTDPHWRLRPSARENWPDGAAPVLELGWIPHELTFVAQGEPPYTLAFGSATIGPPPQPLGDLLIQIDGEQQHSLIRSTQLSPQISLGGEQRLKPPPPWKQWLLWAVLLLGVALLGWMVRRLMGQLRESGDGSG